MFLEPKKIPLGLKKEIGIVLGLSVLGYFGVSIGNYLIDYPLVVLPLLGLIIYWSYRLTTIPVAVRLLFLILAILIPFISMKANFLGSIVLMALLLNLIIALVVVRIAFYLFPVLTTETIEKNKKNPTLYKNISLDKLAFNSFLVVFPLITIFYFYNATITVLTMIFAVILSFDPFIYQSKKGVALIMANIFGGLAGILAYNILVVAPSYLLYILLILSVAFYFAMNLFSGKKIAPIFNISFKTFFVVMGVISTSTDQAGATIWERILQISIAVLYVIIAFKIVNTFNNPKQINE
jgi:MFS family permease